MNWLDILLLFVLFVSTAVSFRKGFSHEVIGLAAALFALVLGMWFYGLAGSFLSPYLSGSSLDSRRVANLCGFLLVVVAVLLCGSLLSWIVGRFLRTVGLSFFDRLLGAAFGFARGSLIVIAVVTAFMAFGSHGGGDSAPASVVHSKLAPYVLEASRWSVAIAPMDLKQSFRVYYSRIRAAVADRSSETKNRQQERLF